MTNVIPYNDRAQVPAHIAKLFAQTGGNQDLSSGVSMGFPIISYRGKVWRLTKNGETMIIADEDGEPRRSIEVVLVKANSALSKLYYKEGYEEGSNEKPTCYSHDGKVPAADVQERQNPTCPGCRHNVFGSKVSDDGKRGKACADFRRMAVSGAGNIEEPMLLRVPAGSLKDLAAYSEALNKRGVPYQGLVTKISFDHEAAYPKMLFKPASWLDDAALAAVAELADSELVRQITGSEPTNALPPSQPEEEPDILDGLGPRPGAANAPQRQARPEPEPEPEPVAPKAKAKSDPFGAQVRQVVQEETAKPSKAATVLEEINSDSDLDAILARALAETDD